MGKELFSASNIDKFSSAFRFLFNKVYIWLVFTVMLLMDIYFFSSTEALLVFNNTVSIHTIIGVMIGNGFHWVNKHRTTFH